MWFMFVRTTSNKLVSHYLVVDFLCSFAFDIKLAAL